MEDELTAGRARRKRALDRSPGTFTYFDSLTSLKDTWEPRSTLGCIDGPLPLDFKFNPKQGSKILSVFFNSQQTGDDLKLFTWQRVSESIPSHRLYIADPTLIASDKLRLGWYAYANKVNAQREIVRLVQYIAAESAAEKLLFFGSSGGGYPAAIMTEYFRSSVGVLVCPALTIEHNPNGAAVKNWLQHCAKSETMEQFRHENPSVLLNAWDALDPPQSASRIIVHNGRDEKFWTHHIGPYVDKCKNLGLTVDSEDLMILEGDWGPGHTPPPAAWLSELLTNIGKHLSEGRAIHSSSISPKS